MDMDRTKAMMTHAHYFHTGFQTWNESPRSGAKITNLDAPVDLKSKEYEVQS
jgi:hypothetical protein